MSFVSAHNFIAPLKSTTHLITIVMIALIFAVWRLNSGDFEVRINEFKPVNARTAGTKKAVGIAPLESSEVRSDSNPAAFPTRPTTAPRDSEIGRLFEPPPSAQEAEPAKNSESSLADIERSLGLR